jgi:hypothetical protein
MGNRCTWCARKVRAGAVPTSIVAGWLVFAMMLVWLFESHALLPRSGLSETFGTWSAESFNFSDRVWRAAQEDSPRAGGDDALVATLAELEDGDGVVVVGDYEDNHTALAEAVEQAQARLEEAGEPASSAAADGGAGGGAAASEPPAPASSSGAAAGDDTVEMTAADGSTVRLRPLKRHPKYGTSVDAQVATDLAPWRARGGGITLADVWLTKHNVTPNAAGSLPRWVPEVVAGNVAYGALFNSSGGIMGRYVRPRYWGRKPAMRRGGGGGGGKGGAGKGGGKGAKSGGGGDKGRQLLEQPPDGGDGSAAAAPAGAVVTSLPSRVATADAAAATAAAAATSAASSAGSGSGAKVDPAVAAADAAEADAYGDAASQPPWGGLEPNPYDGMDNQHGRPLGLFEMWVVDGVPYFALEDAVSSEVAFYWGQLYKINAMWGLLRSSLVEAQRGVLRAQKDKGRAYARALGVPTPADAAQWTAGVVPDVYALINVEPVPLLPRKPEGEAPAAAAGKGAAAGAPVAPRGMAPVLSLCKTDAHWDVLYPNMYFVSPAFWEAQVAKIRDNNRLRPWPARKNLVWWRGSAGYNWPGIAPRLHTLARYYSRKWADIAFTDNWGAVFAIWRRKWRGGVFRARIPAHSYKIRAGKPLSMKMEEVSGYKCVVGAVAGGGSRR